jgi:hypothetical protein
MSSPEAAPVITHPVDDPGLRAAQQERLRRLHDELVAEGADNTKDFDQLLERSGDWPA